MASLAHKEALLALRESRLLRTATEVERFEDSLAELAESPAVDVLPALHLTLDDASQRPEVMFGLVHFLESFDSEAQFNALLEVLPELASRTPGWTRVLHMRMLNDPPSRSRYLEMVRQRGHEVQEAARHVLQQIASTAGPPSNLASELLSQLP